MMRKTDVSRLLPDSRQGSAETEAQRRESPEAPAARRWETATQPSRCDAAVEQATALLIHGMQQSDSPISDLGGALARMARTLSEAGTPLFGGCGPALSADVQAMRDALARDLAVCIQSLQFHDRLMQQLTHARDLLTGHVTNGLLTHVPGNPANEGNIEGSVELF
jgi:hypothetical protein